MFDPMKQNQARASETQVVLKLKKSLFFLIPLFVFIGFFLTYSGMNTWDSFSHYLQSRWLLGSYLGWNEEDIAHLKWYGPLWELILGFFSEIVFKFLNDSTWVRYSVTFALYPTTILLVFIFLIQNKVKISTAILACALFMGNVRLAGHAVLNTKDFPFACAYLLCTLYLWHFIRKTLEKRSQARDLVLGTCVSLVPYLLRTPVILHFLIWVLFIWTNYLILNPLPRKQRIKTLLYLFIPFLSGAVFLFALWPSLWHHFREWVSSFFFMSKFFWQGNVRVFGQIYSQDQVPYWYSLIWILIAFHPLAWLGVAVGTVLCVTDWALTQKEALSPFRFNSSFLLKYLDLRTWLILFTVVTWSAVLLMRPVIYDEDRHLLFLYPPLAILAAFGLDSIATRTKYIWSAISIFTSIVCFVQWGRYSYVYKNPLIGDIHADQFMGDYWGSCISNGVRALAEHVPIGATVQVPEVINTALLQYQRLTTGTFSAILEYGPYNLVGVLPSARPYYVLSYNRMGREKPLLDDLRSGHAIKLWEDKMPPGDSACILVYYPK